MDIRRTTLAKPCESTDWQDAVTQNGQYQNCNFSISGGKNDIQHFLGVDWYDQKGTIKNSSFNKLTVRYNMDAKLNKWLRYGVRFNVIESKLMNINEEADSGYGTMFSAISSNRQLLSIPKTENTSMVSSTREQIRWLLLTCLTKPHSSPDSRFRLHRDRTDKELEITFR